MDKTSLGDRMKTNYEHINRMYLTRRMPLIIRLDGVAFHTLTKKLDRPYDKNFKDCMMETAKFLVENIMGSKMAYVQSDEISLLITDYDKLTTQAWFGKNLQKIISVSASMATMRFNQLYNELIPEGKRIKEYGLFDSRAFVIPKDDVTNYFIFRMNDATRNSIQGLGQSVFSNKEMFGKSCNEIQDMLMIDKDINWNNTPVYFKRGGCVYKSRVQKFESKDDKTNSDVNKKDCDKKRKTQDKQIVLPSNEIIVDYEIPIFQNDRDFIEQFVNLDINRAIIRMVRVEANKLLDECEQKNSINICDTTSISVDDIIKRTDSISEDYNNLINHSKQTEIKEFVDDDLFEHDEFRSEFISNNREYDLQLKGQKDNEFIFVTEGSVVICHLIKSGKITQPLRVYFSGEYLTWVFGNHTMAMLKELDDDIRFTLVKK